MTYMPVLLAGSTEKRHSPICQVYPAGNNPILWCLSIVEKQTKYLHALTLLSCAVQLTVYKDARTQEMTQSGPGYRTTLLSL